MDVAVRVRVVGVSVVRMVHVGHMLMRMRVRMRMRHRMCMGMRSSSMQPTRDRLAHGTARRSRRSRHERHGRRPGAGARCSEQRLGAMNHLLKAALLANEVCNMPLELSTKSRALRRAVARRASADRRATNVRVGVMNVRVRRMVMVMVCKGVVSSKQQRRNRILLTMMVVRLYTTRRRMAICRCMLKVRAQCELLILWVRRRCGAAGCAHVAVGAVPARGSLLRVHILHMRLGRRRAVRESAMCIARHGRQHAARGR